MDMSIKNFKQNKKDSINKIKSNNNSNYMSIEKKNKWINIKDGIVL